MTTVVIGTTNRNKLTEIRHILADCSCSIDSIADHAIVSAPKETGTTFAENARIKARYYGSLVPHLMVAEDSGLEIDRLDGAPGIHSARFAGNSYPETFNRIYEMLDEQGVRTSPARFVCSLAVAEKGGIVFEATGLIEGHIAEEPAGPNGFGYDPIFFYPPFGYTLAQVPGSQKTAVSHRGHSFRKLRSFLDKRFNLVAE
jgi:XTP/dITP diphosphohydrolase